MSWENWAGVTCSGESRAAWQSRHVLGACARAPPAQTPTIVNSRIKNRGKPLLCHVSIDCHRDDIAESEYPGAENETPSALAARLIEERQQQPEKSRQAKCQDAQEISVGKPYLCRNFLERLEHEHEIPFGPDAGRRGSKRIRLRSKFPRRNVNPGKSATWNPKKRVSVAPVTSSPPRKNTFKLWPITGTWPAISVPTLVAKNAKVFQGRR